MADGHINKTYLRGGLNYLQNLELIANTEVKSIFITGFIILLL